MSTTRGREITARELIDWQIELLGFWLSDTGKKYARGFLQDEAAKWGTELEIRHVPDILAQVISRPLYKASPYYVTSEITDLILQAAELRNSMHYRLEPHQLPTDSGFLVFEKQIYLKDIRGDYVGIRAMTWHMEPVSIDPHAGGIMDLDQHPSASGVGIAFYTDTYQPELYERDTSYRKGVEQARAEGLIGEKAEFRGLTRYLLLSHKGLPFGEHDYTANPEQSDDISVMLRTEDAPELSPEFAERIYKGEIQMTGELAQRIKESERGIFFPHDLFVATMLVMNQKITGIAGLPADRAVMRRAKRAGIIIPNTVNIVSLRRLVEQGRIFPNEEDMRDVQWSHRWWVRGHWRRQYYPSRDAHEWVYIDPYVKGPENKPIVDKSDVFFLER